jgi:polysaccharide export outer membrane protein
MPNDDFISLRVFQTRAWSYLLRAVTLVMISALVAQSGAAQQPAQQTVSPVPSSTSASDPARLQPAKDGDDQYRIGVGDQIGIQVFGKAQLSRDQWVDAHGMIKMPLLEEDIRAACRTENELAQEIARLYRAHELLRNPAVYVSVKEYQSQPVAVFGSVNTPGRFILHRQIRLREMLVFFAGGPSAKAGRKVQILSIGGAAACDSSARSAVAESQEQNSFVTYDLQELLAGKESANPLIQRGDIINIPAAEEAFLVGNVLRPSAIPIIEPTTLGRALAMVGGTLPNSKKDKIRVLRQVPGSPTTTEILVDLAAADKLKGTDFLIQGGDIVEVNTKTGLQKVLSDMAKAAIPSISTLPYRAVP